MNIIPDLYLVIIQFIPFFVVIFGLKIILFDPMLAYLHEREVSTHGTRHDAEKLIGKAEEKATIYAAALEKVRMEISEYRAKRRAEANAEYQRVILEARKASEQQVGEALVRLQQETEIARKELAASAHALSLDIAQQALGRQLEG